MRLWTLGRPLAIAAASVILSTTVAYADDISNDLDISIDAVAEAMPLNAGGAAGTTHLYVTPRNGDGKNGCNLTGSTTLVVDVASSDASIATVSPSSLTFGSCGDSLLLTVTPHAQGSATVSLRQTSNNSGGSFNLAPATFTVTVAAPANSAPQLSITGVSEGASYEVGSVPVAGCSVLDDEDGGTAFAATLTAISGPLAGYGLGDQTASCSYTDTGGLTASVSVTYAIVDTTGPAITLLARTPANANGWNNDDVTLTWTCSDGGSGPVEATVTRTLTAEGAGQSGTGTCEDRAGNIATDTQTSIDIDKTAPIAAATASPDANANGWNKTDVTVSFSGIDGLSGIDVCSDPVVLSGEGAGQSASGTCTDLAGNVSDVATAGDIDIDKTDPTITWNGGPAEDASYYFGSVPAAPTCDAADGLSGPDGCAVSGYSALVGGHTLEAAALDKAGNEATETRAYTVLAWTLSGFHNPVDMNDILNTVKGGSTVPLKFEIFAGSTELTSSSAIASFRTAKVDCGLVSRVATDEIEATSTGGTSLRYDATGGQFIQNWQTPRTPGLCLRAVMTALDGSSLTAYFELK
jgi:hypothetical protein